jgi:hypothetical protein
MGEALDSVHDDDDDDDDDDVDDWDRIGEGRMDLNEARLLLDLGGFAETKIFSRTRELCVVSICETVASARSGEFSSSW